MINNKLAFRCIDINSDYCPCLLAATNHCVFCSHLKGEPACSCDWSGVCILYNKYWDSRAKVHLAGKPVPVRINEGTEFSIKQQISKNIFWLQLPVSPELAAKLKKTGSFIFIRKYGDPEFYHFPVGIMKIRDNILEVVVDATGPKSAKIFGDNNRKLMIRGPYYNGVLGQPWLDNLTAGNVILVAGGMGQALTITIAEQLRKNGNTVRAILAPGHIGQVFVESELQKLGLKISVVSSLRKNGLPLLYEWLKENPDLLVSSGPDEQHNGLIIALQSVGINIPMAATNNAVMCCGEGICGSCQKETRSGQKVRTCKVQTRYVELIND